MSTIITSDNGVEITVGLLALEVTDPVSAIGVYARLSDAQRVELAAALDPGRHGLHVRLDNQAATLATYRRERDEALRKKGEAFDRAVRAERERDAAVARAEAIDKQLAKVMSDYQDVEDERDEWKARAEKVEQLIPAYAMVDVWMALGRDSIHFDDWYDERGYADAWAELVCDVRDCAVAAEASTGDSDPAVYVVRESQLDSVQVKRESPRWRTRHAGVTKWITNPEQAVVDARLDLICALAAQRAIEAEQAVDPVEEKARELYRAATPDARWETVADEYRRIAAHVLGQEATR